ncbi:helix-turn-helix domain-containing protein, partial [Rhizobium ruizarguesonis]
MSQSQRLFEILQILRLHRQAVSGNYLAQETGVSLRTIYRAPLRSQRRWIAATRCPGR